MSAACTLTVVEVEELHAAMGEQREAMVRILAEADAARNGVGVSSEILFESVGKIATAITTISDALDECTEREVKS